MCGDLYIESSRAHWIHMNWIELNCRGGPIILNDIVQSDRFTSIFSIVQLYFHQSHQCLITIWICHKLSLNSNKNRVRNVFFGGKSKMVLSQWVSIDCSHMNKRKDCIYFLSSNRSTMSVCIVKISFHLQTNKSEKKSKMKQIFLQSINFIKYLWDLNQCNGLSWINTFARRSIVWIRSEWNINTKALDAN